MTSISLVFFPGAALSYNWQIVAGAVSGILIGALLVKCSFCDRSRIRNLLKLADRDLVATLAGMLFFGLILRWAACRYNILPENCGVSAGRALNSIIGGILCGVGLYLGGFAPLSALAGVGNGKLTAVWAIVGMLIALPVLQWCDEKVSFNHNWNKALPVGKVSWDFFDSGNPALYAVVALAIVLLTLALRRNSN